mmetsp:Transcript_98449/g.175347  ORF Transcript_98449/g.175347 Transcript_98449/m.175347 type:complete len:582 (+) Transcript_98449:26-1771(+)|eukprot:CAMPEP_0197665464 /NCGR_PEP_ID=MMETSP1338-20131121/59238_1 /TAXON_ID=43686 ORGANISM="Pelagodinium beii, Strain RCC1491" /NCGR_SAMPLE_ID=MMETSP1338 /ASSEMBLY_ACC=CAM_ASM_000754 /LENGTH=581 /DNA_ID=CAMNT_0043244269 /DNA_START=26 /DNA_END=1771 /DNA_ORIENTATION=-
MACNEMEQPAKRQRRAICAGKAVLNLRQKGLSTEDIADALGLDVEDVLEAEGSASSESRASQAKVIERLLHDPEEFTCSICWNLMREPVVAQDGFTYEKSDILQHLAQRQASPTTGADMGVSLVENKALKSQISIFKEKTTAEILKVLPQILLSEPSGSAKLLQRVCELLGKTAPITALEAKSKTELEVSSLQALLAVSEKVFLVDDVRNALRGTNVEKADELLDCIKRWEDEMGRTDFTPLCCFKMPVLEQLLSHALQKSLGATCHALGQAQVRMLIHDVHASAAEEAVAILHMWKVTRSLSSRSDSWRRAAVAVLVVLLSSEGYSAYRELENAEAGVLVECVQSACSQPQLDKAAQECFGRSLLPVEQSRRHDVILAALMELSTRQALTADVLRKTDLGILRRLAEKLELSGSEAESVHAWAILAELQAKTGDLRGAFRSFAKVRMNSPGLAGSAAADVMSDAIHALEASSLSRVQELEGENTELQEKQETLEESNKTLEKQKKDMEDTIVRLRHERDNMRREKRELYDENKQLKESLDHSRRIASPHGSMGGGPMPVPASFSALMGLYGGPHQPRPGR